MAEELDISVSFVLNLPGGDKAVTVPRKAELYDEANPDKWAHKRCVAITGICSAPDPNGVSNLLPWVEQDVSTVIIYSNTPGSLALGDSGTVGLTNELQGPWTKVKAVLVADPIAPFTVEGLRKAGLI